MFVPRGVLISIPWGVPRCQNQRTFKWRNTGPGLLRYFALYMPAGFEQFFRDAPAAVEQAGGMPP
jgi:hypothetical protein